MNECPDHDRLIVIETIIAKDHESMKQRLAALEANASRLMAVVFIVGSLSAVLGAVIEKLFR